MKELANYIEEKYEYAKACGVLLDMFSGEDSYPQVFVANYVSEYEREERLCQEAIRAVRRFEQIRGFESPRACGERRGG
eukprot:7192030-Alexandrium_andersonii.AAC.1